MTTDKETVQKLKVTKDAIGHTQWRCPRCNHLFVTFLSPVETVKPQKYCHECGQHLTFNMVDTDYPQEFIEDDIDEVLATFPKGLDPYDFKERVKAYLESHDYIPDLRLSHVRLFYNNLKEVYYGKNPKSGSLRCLI